MTTRLCRICKNWHELSEPWPYECRGHFPPAPHQTLNIIGDNLDYVMNMADGKRYSSKSAYYKAVRRAGCEIVGNETPRASTPKMIDDPINDIRHAVERYSGRAGRKGKSRGR